VLGPTLLTVSVNVTTLLLLTETVLVGGTVRLLTSLFRTKSATAFTFIVMLAVSSPVLINMEVAPNWASTVRFPLILGSIMTVVVYTAESPAAIMPRLQLGIPCGSPAQPVVTTPLKPVGRVSVTTTPVASSGPCYTIEEIDRSIQRPVVQSLFQLIRFRNQHPAFNGSFSLPETPDSIITLRWDNGDDWAMLEVVFASGLYSISNSCNKGKN
jgi:hypothetical protein